VKAIVPYCQGKDDVSPRYFVSDDPEAFEQFAKRLLGGDWVGRAELVDIEKY